MSITRLRRVAVLAAVVLVLPFLTAVAVDPATAAPRADQVQVLAPGAGTVRVAPSLSAARATRLTAAIRVTGPADRLTVLLNGHRVPGVAARAGTTRVLLSARRGLRVGANLLWVSVRFRGAGTPRVVPVRFVVGYRAGGLLTSTLRLGGGSGPAAALTVRAPLTGVDRLTGSLGGRPVALPPATLASGGHRLLRLDLARLGALRFGRTRVRLQLVMSDGRVQDLSRTFTLGGSRAIAVARTVGATTVGSTVTLTSAGSRIVPGTRGQMHWLLLHRPARSQAHLGASTAARSTLRPDVPGHYVVALRVGTGRHTGIDVLDVAATYADPLVPVDTIAYSNSSPPVPGLQIGGTFYQSDDQALQVYILDRATLGLLAYRGYQATAQSFDTLGSYLQTLPATDLVVVTHAGTQAQAPLPSDSLTALDGALRAIGGTLGAQWNFPSGCWSGGTNYCETSSAHWSRGVFYGGSFTVIGVPGLAAGQAWRETATQNGALDGRIVGYLTLGVTTATGVANQYTVVPGPDPYLPVQTCSTAGCAVQVGGQSYPATGGNGLHVVVLDRTTLRLQLNRTVTTTADLQAALNPSAIPAVGHLLLPPGLDDQRLVILQSIGDGRLTGTPTGSQLIQEIDQLGGTPETFLDAITGAHRYALVGAATDLPWHATGALESSDLMPGGVSGGRPTGQISGELQRDRTGLYAPLAGDPVAPTNTDLYRILYQSSTAWPLAGDPALPYIADGIGLAAYPDVRSAYLNLNIDFGTKATLLTTLTCTGQPFCGSDFDTAKAQLLKEFDWVQSEKNVAANLLSPYEQNGQAPYFDVQEVTDELLAGVPVPASSQADMQWLTIMIGVMGIAAKASAPLSPEASAVFGVLGAAGGLATQLMQTPTGGPGDAVRTAASQLAVQMSHQQTAYVEWVSRMQTIMLSDYGRLSAVGSAAPTPAWAWTPDTTTDAITALDGGTRSSAYTALLPIAWGGYNLKPGANLSGSDDVGSYVCDEPDNYPNHHTPFAAALPQNQFHAATAITSGGTLTDQVWTFAQLQPWGLTGAYAGLPGTSLTDRIYGPQSTGPEGAYQYAPAWWRDTYDPPGHVTCQKGEGSMPINQVWSQNYPPPVITPPLP